MISSMSLISCRCSVSTTLCLSMCSKQCELQAPNAFPKMLGKRPRRRKSSQVALLSLLLSQATQIRACETRGIGVVFLCVCGERFVSESAQHQHQHQHQTSTCTSSCRVRIAIRVLCWGNHTSQARQNLPAQRSHRHARRSISSSLGARRVLGRRAPFESRGHE